MRPTKTKFYCSKNGIAKTYFFISKKDDDNYEFVMNNYSRVCETDISKQDLECLVEIIKEMIAEE